MDLKLCSECEDGVRFVSDGMDDVIAEFCSCEKGEAKQFFAWLNEEKKLLAKRMHV